VPTSHQESAVFSPVVPMAAMAAQSPTETTHSSAATSSFAPSDTPVYSDTEDVVQALEELALGRKLVHLGFFNLRRKSDLVHLHQYVSLGLNTLVPCVGKLQPKERVSWRNDFPDCYPYIPFCTQAFSPPPQETSRPGALTTIFTAPSQNPQSLFIGGPRDHRISLLDAIPERRVSDLLVKEFFTDLSWVYCVSSIKFRREYRPW